MQLKHNKPEKPPERTNPESSPELIRQLQKREAAMLANLLDVRKREGESINKAIRAYSDHVSWLSNNAESLKNHDHFNARAVGTNLTFAEYLLGKEKTIGNKKVEISSREDIGLGKSLELPRNPNNIYLLNSAPIPIDGQGYNRILPPRSIFIAHKGMSNNEEGQGFHLLTGEGVGLTKEETTTSVYLLRPVTPRILTIDSATEEPDMLCTVSVPPEREEVRDILDDMPCEVVTYEVSDNQ